MSNDIENRTPDNNVEKRRRRRREDAGGKQPIKLVSALGEGKLLERFQSSVTEKEKKRKKNDKSEKMRQMQKEKRDREIAKFKAEINALMEEEVQPLKPSEKMKTFVPKMTGTVKGKFEELEKKRQEDEKKKAENERRRRNEKDLREKKRIEVELAKKKLKQGSGDDFDLARAEREFRATLVQHVLGREAADADKPAKLSIDFEAIVKEKERQRQIIEAENREKALEAERINLSQDVKKEEGVEETEDVPSSMDRRSKEPGKLNASNFEEMARQKVEKEKKKAEMERKIKMEAERRAFKEMSTTKSEDDSEEEDTKDETDKRKAQPRKLTTKFDEIARAREEEQRRVADEESRWRLEEEKRRFRAEKMAAKENESESDATESGSAESVTKTPSRLSSSFTKFDVIEKERLETERKRIQERRKKLLEEEMKIFEESKKNFNAGQESSTDDEKEIKKASTRRVPRRLDSSFTKFDIMNQQKLQEKREKIQQERKRLLEDEKKMFAEQKRNLKSNDSDGSITVSSSGSMSPSEREDIETKDTNEKKKKLTKRRKKPKRKEEGPTKLDRSKLKFDVLERQRMEKERWEIQEQRRKLLDEEKRIFEEARKRRLGDDEEDNSEAKENGEDVISPNKLDYAKTRFDIMAQHKMEEERKKIREERSRLLREEKRLFEEERNRMKDMNEEEEQDDIQTSPTQRKPSRLDKSFTEFDIISEKRKDEERARIMQESQRKLEEEKRMFQEERKKMEEAEESDDSQSQNSNVSTPRTPQKLSKSFTNFDTIARKRMEDERRIAYEEKVRQLEEEKRSFAEAKEHLKEEESDSDDSAETSQSFSPNRLSSKLSNFEELEKQRIEKERVEAQEKKIREMEEELQKFKEERKYMNDSDKEEKSEIPSPQVRQPRPKKLSSGFTKFDELQRRRQEEERRKLREQKEQELAEERRRFQESREADQQSGTDEDEREIMKLHRPISKLNVRQQMEAVLQAQREVEQKKIMETKFCRMTVEQQEMFLAKEKQLQLLQEKLARAQAEYEGEEYSSYSSDEEESDEENSSDEYEYYCENQQPEMRGRSNCTIEEEKEEEEEETEDESEEEESETENGELPLNGNSCTRDDVSTPGSNDSGYTGAPWFTETLSNITLNEGDPVRFDAVIHADPHPKVTWYFKNRVIRNSPDYQHINKGTHYSLYMNESFYDDMGEYMCKAENSKGIATSKAILTVIEKDD